MMLSSINSSISLYIHWPFCLSRCPYCDFNTYVARSVDEDAFLQGFRQELSYMRQATDATFLHSIFFGGGTPSLMSPRLVQELLECTAHLWAWADSIEITLEANPSTVESEKFLAYKAAGINRISLGLQSLCDEQLAFLGRRHSATQARQGLNKACALFDKVSADFIYALPDQSLAAWRLQLKEILNLGLSHLSLYQLTIEEKTPFGKDWARGKLIMPSPDLTADLYLLTEEMAQMHHFVSYEVSNYAQSPAYFSQHNLAYWHYDDYIGVGPGAHGRLRRNNQHIATQTHKQPQTWLKQILEKGHGLEIWHPLSLEESAQEMILMGLRTILGLSLRQLRSLGYDINQECLGKLIEEELVFVKDDTLITTLKGRLVLNTLTQALCSNLEPIISLYDRAFPDVLSSPALPKIA